MGVYLPNVDMPKDKAVAVVIHPDGTAYTAEMFAGVCTEYLSDCTAVFVPPHGRLIDADALLKKCEFVCTDDDEDIRAVRYSVIEAAPTIIPPEEK